MTQLDLLVFARAVGLVARAPGFSHPSVPPMVRAGLALALAGLVAPSAGAVGNSPASAPFGAHVKAFDLATFTLAVASEAATGAAIGFGAALLYDGAYFAGRTIDDYLGVRGSVPGAKVTSAQAFGRLWSAAFLAAYVLLDGWVPVVDAFAESFAHVPSGGLVDPHAWSVYALALPQTILRAALLVAAPAIAVAAALQLALAGVTRIVPRLASVTLAFPAVFAAALIVTVVALPVVARVGGHPWLVVPWTR
ncbi:MAG TPA: flagellar biosynthetic protein FliR [Candidatus Baltobacteraceae bacterium]|nr:flagellar biosynthetic protein FliR [Candidatus Baltobacteraceae bacterium]